MKNKLNIVVFLGILGGLCILNLMSPDQAFSNNENRYLAQMPSFSVEALLNHSYTTKFEDYLNDQFIGRDYWVEGKTLNERLLGKQENNGVYFAKDGYLIEKLPSVDSALVQKNIDAINAFVENNEIVAKMMLIPGASTIYRDKLPINDELDQLSLIDEVASKLSNKMQFISVNDLFLANSHQDIYFKTDHHFNMRGAGLAYSAFSNTDKEHQYEVVSKQFLGTLASQSGAYYTEQDEIVKLLNDEDIEVDYFDSIQDNNTYNEENLLVKDKCTYYLNGNHSLVSIKTNQVNKPKLLILRDSYANIFVPYLLEDYSEIYVVDMRYNKTNMSEFVKEKAIDELLVFYSAKNFMSESDLIFLK